MAENEYQMKYDTFDTYAALIGGAEVAYRRLESGDTTPELLDVVAKHPGLAYCYARDIKGARFTEGEPSIAQYPSWAYNYARYVIRDRWPMAEPAIAQHRWWARLYARDIIRGQWLEAGIYEI